MILFTHAAERLRISVPQGARQRLRRLLRPALLGSLRRTAPLSGEWGFDRGMPVDRYYIERFLQQHAADIRGRVLEVKDSAYSNRFGIPARTDVLDINPANPHATVVADLAAADHVPGEQFDCFILTQTLQLIYDVHAAIGHAHRLLRPGGTLLVTVPSTSRLAEPDYWRFTPAVCERLFGDVFGRENVAVTGHGNVLTNVAFLEGMAWQELSQRELDAYDELFPMLVTVRAVRARGLGYVQRLGPQVGR
jgi:hypothetical protein